MTPTLPPSSRHARRRQSGFTLLNVLVAAFLFGIGMLGIARTFSGVTSASTQNEYVTSLASLSNGFWSTVQANPALVAASGFDGGIYGTAVGATAYTSAPAALQPWLKELVQTLPGVSASITNGRDSASGQTCDVVTGCTITLTILWAQTGMTGTTGITRSQTFQYRISQS